VRERTPTPDQIETYQRDGVVLIKGLFADHVETLRQGVERNMASPGPFASNNVNRARRVVF
jgi:hypothetical protein